MVWGWSSPIYSGVPTSIPSSNHTVIPHLSSKEEPRFYFHRSYILATNLDPFRTRNSIHHYQDAIMPTVYSRNMALQEDTKAPGFGLLLISTGVIGDECSLCGNAFETYEASNLPLRLPCVDHQCGPCARMWKVLSSPTCLVCYGNFQCPQLTRKEAQQSLPRLITDMRDTFQETSPLDAHIDSFLSFQDSHTAFHSVDAAQKSLPRLGFNARDTPQPTSPLDSDIDSFLNFRDRHAAFHNANAVPEDVINTCPGSPMREDEDAQAVPELSEDLLEALTMANDRIGTKFNFQDIEAEIPSALLRNCSRFQLADRLTQVCINKLSEGCRDNASKHSSSEQPKKDDVDPGRCTIQKAKSSHRCTQCPRSFRSSGHLRQHMIVHTPTHRTCSVCGQVLGNANSRRIHERRHRETEGEREARLGKAKAAREQSRAQHKVVTY